MIGYPKVHKSEVNEYLQPKYMFICCASFEKRCLTIPTCLSKESIECAYIIKNIGSTSCKLNELNARQITSKIGNAKIMEADFDAPVSISSCISAIIGQIIGIRKHDLVIDISTFTHEVLLVLTYYLHRYIKQLGSITMLYNGADSYSSYDSQEKIWLSKGCRIVRNVIGYPGILKPSLKYHLIILSGFELERATRLIEVLEPDVVTIAKGSDPIEKSHSAIMRYFENEFMRWKNGLQCIDCDSFAFSCRDVDSTINAIEGYIKSRKEENIILVPLNTKISTVASALVALRNPRIQLCYTIPEVYNSDNYSTPSSNVTVIDIKKKLANI